MDVVPVIDLMGGQVVHARRGERGAYQPIHSPLVEGARPQAVADALLALAPFRRLYVADLDAIRGTGGHDTVIAEIAEAYPELEIWVDRGETDPDALGRRARAGPGVSVIGSESFKDPQALRSACGASGGVLSLDHDANGPIGPADSHGDSSFWPDRVIVMTLARVGADAGPDISRLRDVLGRAGDRRVYAAGGVRGAHDLAALSALGVAGALVASALHDGRLSREALAEALRGEP